MRFQAIHLAAVRRLLPYKYTDEAASLRCTPFNNSIMPLQPEPFAPPLFFVAWGFFFHPFAAFLGYRMTTSIPFVGTGAAATMVRVVFFVGSLCTILNHVYHLLARLGVSLEVQDVAFLSGLVMLLPNILCLCRCFFLELSRKQALLLTALNIFSVTAWPPLTKTAFGLPSEQPANVIGTPEYFRAQRFAPAQHFTVELGITLVYLVTYSQMAPVLSKARKAD